MAITQGVAGSGGGGGGGAATLAAGSVSAGAYVLGSILDGAIVTLGALGDVAVGDASGSLNAHTRQIAKLLGAGIALGAGAAVIGAVTQSGTWNVTVNTALPAGANAIGTVSVTSLPALPAGANSIGTVVLGAGAAVVGAVTQSGTWNVTVNTALPTGTNTIGAVTGPGAAALATDRTTAAAPFSNQLSDGAAFYVGAKTGQLPTALVGARLDVNLGAAPATVTVQGGAAAGAALAGNPVRIGVSDGTNTQDCAQAAAAAAAFSNVGVLRAQIGVWTGTGSLTPLLSATAIGASGSGSGSILAAASYAFNGSSHDEQRNNIDATLLASASRTTTQGPTTLTTFNLGAIVFVLDMTTVGTGSVTLTISEVDPASGKSILLLSGAAVTTNSTNVYIIDPMLTAAANSIAKNRVTRTLSYTITANNANPATYSLGAMEQVS